MSDADDPRGPRGDLEDEDGRHRIRGRIENLLPNAFRRTGTARQYTEDVIRNALGDMKLPKEVVTTLVDVADNTKKEVVRVAAREFREFLDSARFNEELAKILTQLSFEIRTEIRFVPNDQALRPMVSTSAQVKSDSGETVEAGPGTTESINEAVRGHATELVEVLLTRILRGKETAREEERGEGAARDQRASEPPRPASSAAAKAPEPPSSDKERAPAGVEPDTASAATSEDKVEADDTPAAEKKPAPKRAPKSASSSTTKKPASTRRKATGTKQKNKSAPRASDED